MEEKSINSAKEYTIIEGERNIAEIKLEGRVIVLQQISQIMSPGNVYFTVDKWLEIASVLDEIALEYYRKDNA